MLNLPGVFALLTRYAPAPRVASPPPQAPAGEKCAHPAGEKRSKDYIRTCPGPKSEAPADALSLYLSRTRQELDSRRRLLSGTKSSVP